jgi:hypothetical protein
MVNETGVANVTVRGTDADIPAYVAEMFVLPPPIPAVATPARLIVATLVKDDAHVGLLITFVVPSE